MLAIYFLAFLHVTIENETFHVSRFVFVFFLHESSPGHIHTHMPQFLKTTKDPQISLGVYALGLSQQEQDTDEWTDGQNN